MPRHLSFTKAADKLADRVDRSGWHLAQATSALFDRLEQSYATVLELR
jgi:hypothetical protein